MATENIETIKQDALISIEVSAACYFTVKDMFLEHLDAVKDQKETIIRLADANTDLNLNETTMRFLLDFVKACEDSAKANGLTERRDIVIPDTPTENPS